MAKSKYTIYKHIKLSCGWRYCKAAWHSNGKIKPNVVIVGGKEEAHREGSYYLYNDGRWLPAGDDALEAVKLKAKRLSEYEYQRTHGTLPEAKLDSKKIKVTLEQAISAYLAEIDLAIRAKNKRPGSRTLMANTLRRFSGFAKDVKYLHDITPEHLTKYAAHVIETSPTHSRETGRNHYLRMLQFLKSHGIVLTKVYGDKQEKIGWKDAPKTIKKKRVITNTLEELEKFFGACGSFKQWATFQTFRRAGLREAELITTRVQDVVLDAEKPYIDVCARTVDGFEYVPKWYAERQVNIDSDLADTLREMKKTAKGGLMFGTASGHVNCHLLRECKRIAERAGLPPERFRLHRFRANYATHCLRQGMDLETLREQLGHRDTESLRCYIDALKGEQRAEKVEQVWSDTDKVVPITWKQRKTA